MRVEVYKEQEVEEVVRLKLTQEPDRVTLSVVTEKGGWMKDLLTFAAKGTVERSTDATFSGPFSFDSNGRIIIE